MAEQNTNINTENIDLNAVQNPVQNPVQNQSAPNEQQGQTVIESFSGTENISLNELEANLPERDELDEGYYGANQEVEGLLSNSNFRLIMAIVVVFLSAIILWLILR